MRKRGPGVPVSTPALFPASPRLQEGDCCRKEGHSAPGGWAGAPCSWRSAVEWPNLLILIFPLAQENPAHIDCLWFVSQIQETFSPANTGKRLLTRCQRAQGQKRPPLGTSTPDFPPPAWLSWWTCRQRALVRIWRICACSRHHLQDEQSLVPLSSASFKFTWVL